MGRKIYTGKNVGASGPYSHVVDAREYLFFFQVKRLTMLLGTMAKNTMLRHKRKNVLVI